MTVPGNGFERMAALAGGDEPVDAAFAARLRRRVERALGVPAVRITLSPRVDVLTTAIATNTISEGHHHDPGHHPVPVRPRR